MVDKIACFLTCGYTEAGAMQALLRKINGRYDYKQCLPNKSVKKKGTPKVIDKRVNGLTGEKLLEKVYEIIKAHKTDILGCKAIILEDDLDGRFYGWKEEQITDYKKTIIDKIHEILGQKIPVFILYAAPEVESWFIADWKNGFEYLYGCTGVIKDVESRAKLFFTHHLKQYIDVEILKEYANAVEDYGYFDGKYVKLSDQLKNGIQCGVKDYIAAIKGTNKDYVNQIVNSRDIFYLKSLHGNEMLKNISPEILADRCREYFALFYHDLHNFAE